MWLPHCEKFRSRPISTRLNLNLNLSQSRSGSLSISISISPFELCASLFPDPPSICLLDLAPKNTLDHVSAHSIRSSHFSTSFHVSLHNNRKSEKCSPISWIKRSIFVCIPQYRNSTRHILYAHMRCLSSACFSCASQYSDRQSSDNGPRSVFWET